MELHSVLVAGVMTAAYIPSRSDHFQDARKRSSPGSDRPLLTAENETELSLFNRAEYDAFKQNPEVGWRWGVADRSSSGSS